MDKVQASKFRKTRNPKRRSNSMLEALESIFCFIRKFQIGNYYEEVSLLLQNMCIWDNNLLPALTFSSSNAPLIIINDNHIFPFIVT